MQHNTTIFESLFNRNFSEPESEDFLKELTARHPYFSPAQFFLLQKTEANTELFEKQAVKTNILFNNPHWLNFQLHRSDMQEPARETLHTVPSGRVEEVIAPLEEVIVPAAIETVDITPEPAVDLPGDTNAVEEEVMKVEEIIAPVAIETVDITPEPALDLPDDTNAVEEKVMKVEEIIAPAPLETVDITPEPAVDLPDDTDAAEEAVMETEIEPMKIELKMPEEKTNLDEAMLFEPMHMVDYFASQGIKLSDEVQTADKLGKQLKSFTEWLKTMKKVHVPNETEAAVETDDNIQTLAENSNTEAEVLTESMAEVFARQGKMGKASEVYQKLSLLNPAKSTYFAAKIENLKGI